MKFANAIEGTRSELLKNLPISLVVYLKFHKSVHSHAYTHAPHVQYFCKERLHAWIAAIYFDFVSFCFCFFSLWNWQRKLKCDELHATDICKSMVICIRSASFITSRSLRSCKHSVPLKLYYVMFQAPYLHFQMETMIVWMKCAHHSTHNDTHEYGTSTNCSKHCASTKARRDGKLTTY